MMKPVRIFATLFAAAITTSAQVTFPSLNSAPFLGQEMLGRVTNNSVTLNVAFDRDMQVFIDYGTVPGKYATSTADRKSTRLNSSHT